MSVVEKRILVVDDHATNRLKLSMAVKTLGHSANVAENGVQALEMLQAEVFDLVLLDVMMPEMDGHEVLAYMKGDVILRDIPVIVISSLDEMSSIVTCIERGAEDYLPKDFEPTLLKARIGASLEKKRLRDAATQQLTFIRDIFGKYVPESVVKQIVEKRSALEPVGTKATILFSDIERFTSIAETMEPKHVFDMLNEYFQALIEVITRNGGVVNQFQGDAMLITFNIPVEDQRHADNAILTALEMQSITNSREFSGVKLATRIGINSGDVIAGNIGSGDRFNYTVHGDAVNLAARLEHLNKQYGTRVLVSQSTVDELVDDYELSLRGKVTIRGKQDTVQIYDLLLSH